MKNLTYLLLIIVFASCTACMKDEPPVIDPGPGGETIGLSVQDINDFELELSNGTEPVTWTIIDNQIRIDKPGEIVRMHVGGKAVLDVSEAFKAMPSIQIIETITGVTATGDISNLPESLTHLDIKAGEMTGMPMLHRGIIRFRIGIGNEVSVDVSDLPASLTYLCLNEKTSAFGKINANFPPNMDRCNIMGDNTVTGDYGLLGQKFPAVFNLSGNNRVDDYTPGMIDFSKTNMRIFIHDGTPGYGLSSNEVDNLLVDLSKSTWTGGNKRLTISGSHAPRTPLSNNAVISLQSQGVTVQTN